MPRSRVFLVDGYSNIFRAYYAIRGLSSSKGQPTNAVYGFLTMLRKLLRDESPELVGVALDVSRKTVRSERFADYKANRSPMPDDLKSQMPWVRKVTEAFRIPIVEHEGFEADDVIGTLAKKAAADGYDVVIISADKDLMQLVGPHVSLFHTGREILYTPELVERDFGVRPERVIDVLALVGDSVDNVPGVPGIGAKGARSLVSEYGSLDELLERVDEIKRKSYREGLTEHRDLAELSRELVTIHTDLELDFDPAALRLEEPDTDALREIFSELEFFSLLEELGSDPIELDVEPATEASTADTINEAFAGVDGVLRVVPLGPAGAEALAVAGADRSWLIDLRREGVGDEVRGHVQSWLDAPERTLVGHDLKEVVRLATAPGRTRCGLRDVMVQAYLANPALKAYGLAEIALESLQYRAASLDETGWHRGESPALGDHRLAALAGERIELIDRLADGMEDRLEGELADVYDRIEAPLIPVLAAMEERGIGLDVEFLAGMSTELGTELDGLAAAIYEEAGEEFNLNSPRQLGEILFEKLGYPVIKKTRKTKSYSTDAETLEELASRGYPLPEHLLRYRELSKLRSTYVDALPTLVGDDGRLHTRFHQAVAATGRLSSADPNLQNIPVRTEAGQQIRRAFAAPEGRVLVVADYSQIELRILAHIANEERLIEAFQAGEDIHRSTAAKVFGVSPALVAPDQRRAAKVINFGIIYGMSAFGLARNLKISRGEAKSFIDAYFATYPGVQAYTESTLEQAEADGKVETLFGRVRWLPELASRNRAVRENAKRMAINARIQGTAADLLKLAMIAVHRRLEREQPESFLLLTVHDELVVEAPAGKAETVAATIREEMAGVFELAVPLVVDAGWGRTWYDAKGS